MKKILITGAAGFIGFHLVKKILEQNSQVEIFGFDNVNNYYDVNLKESRLNILKQYSNFRFIKGDLANESDVKALFKEAFDVVVNLAAQAGVRYSIQNPKAYINSNIIGFFNLLEACRSHMPEHLVYASSSSVYGNNTKVPYSIEDKTDSPVSLYAATKKSNELLAYSYSTLYGIKSTGLRFFTVYGEYGRPDMAYFKFTEQMRTCEPIKLFNNGDMRRDFTYIDDIVKGIMSVMQSPPALHDIYNIGNNKPVSLLEFIDTLESVLLQEDVIGKKAERQFVPMQPGDVYQTFADVDNLSKKFDFKPNTKLSDGLQKFAKWYKEYYRL